MSVTRKAPTAAKKRDKPRRQRLAEVLAEREAELAEARRQNARLFDEVQAKTHDLEEALQEALRQQTATSDILRVIASSPNDLQPVLDNIVETACRLCSAYDAVVLLREGDQLRIVAHHGPIPITFASQQISRGWASGRAVIERRTIHIDDIAEQADEYPVAAALASRGVAAGSGKMLWRANLVVPLMRESEAVGVIGLRRAEAVRFSEGQIELLKTFSDQAVIAIENARLFDEVQSRTRDLEEALQQQTATADVLKAISRTAFDLDTVLETLVSTAVRLCNATRGGQIFRRHGEVYRYAASQMNVDPAYLRHEQTTEIKPGRGTLVGRVALENRVVHIVDAWNDPEYAEKDEARLGNVRAMLGVPLLRNGEPVGAFALGRAEPIPFTDRQIDLVTTFADQAVIAIENARLFDEVQAKTRDLEESLTQQTSTADVLKVISRSAFDLQAVFDTLISSAIALIGADQGSLWMRDGDLFRFRAYHGHSADYVAWVEDHPLRAGRSSSVGRVAMTKQVASIPDVLEDLEYTPPANAIMGVRSVLAAPLLRDGEVEGVFVIFRRVPGDFSQRQIELVQTFADQAMIAIGNVRLFDEVQARTKDVQESLAQQTATADVLKVISRSAFDLPAVLRTLVESAAKLCDADKATITREVNGVYYRAESYGFSEEFMGQIRNIPVAPERGSITGRAMLEGKAIQVEDVEADPEYWPKNFAKRGELRTGLGIPMMRNGASIGVIALMRTAVRPFNSKQIELVQTFADQAVIAIENARLFDEVQARTRDLTEALQQQTATANVLKVISRSAFDLQAVLTTLAESARDLCGASFVTLSLREGDAMRLRAESGCTPEIIQFMGAHPIRAGRETFTGRVMLSGEAVHLPDVFADPEYDFGEGPRIGNYRALLAVPLLREGRVEGLRGPFGVRQVLGVFALARPDPVPFTERQIEMVRAFADQAVIAIENARLFNEVQSRTKELAASLDDLRKAQDRLIQSEKLASLGQLTAGIAHEIKNPLNFINNYSALSRELVDELADAIKGAAGNEATHGEADELIGAIGGNLDKIVQHGKRADSIVKNMLLHSREGSGERVTTNVNMMVEEALNLAYHGARAEKPGFNVTIAKSLDPNAGAAEVYAQEMSRVLLNLISNGFYATSKHKQSAADGAYEPTISASTRNLGPKVEIAIRDNGTGISDEVKAKMFNPFFTTKPAGEGTGLGLSLSHDIVVKQHGGTIEVLTEPDAFTQFTIVLPRDATGA
jgi:two-component system NtrC family sensor kinase